MLVITLIFILWFYHFDRFAFSVEMQFLLRYMCFFCHIVIKVYFLFIGKQSGLP